VPVLPRKKGNYLTGKGLYKALMQVFKATHPKYQPDMHHYAHIDCPDHADYIKNMIISEMHVSNAILFIFVSNLLIPQINEHIILAYQNSMIQKYNFSLRYL